MCRRVVRLKSDCTLRMHNPPSKDFLDDGMRCPGSGLHPVASLRRIAS
jgi:hypothetical protein